MDENKILKWVDSVINGLPVFLENMKDKNTPGRFKYSLTGDISSDSNWGVGNTVFAVKTYFMLNLFWQNVSYFLYISDFRVLKAKTQFCVCVFEAEFFENQNRNR